MADRLLARPLTPHTVFSRPVGPSAPVLEQFLLEAPERGSIELRYDATRHIEEVLLAGRPLEQKFVAHSPTGFAWGYAGSGPADLALNILGVFVHPAEAWRLHQHFKLEWLAALERQRSHELSIVGIRRWIADRWTEAREKSVALEGRL